MSRVIDFSKTVPGNTDWRAPTAMTSRGGSLCTGTLTPFPVKVGAAEIFKVNPRTGRSSVFATGLTTVLGLAFGADGALYVLEMSVKNGGPAPNTGEVVRIKGSHRTLIATGLNFPTGMAFGPDGNLYVSANGLGAPPSAGQVVRITMSTGRGCPLCPAGRASVIRFRRFAVTRTLRPSTITMLTITNRPLPGRLQSP